MMKINTARRVLLTGTPLQNNLLELLSLLNFVMPKVFHGATNHLLGFFRQLSPDQNDNELRETMIAKARRIMDPFMLRRKKDVVLTDLPEKKHVVTRCPLTPAQQLAYDGLVEALKQALLTATDSSGKATQKSGVVGLASAAVIAETAKADAAKTDAMATELISSGRRTRRSGRGKDQPELIKPEPVAPPPATVAESGHVQNSDGLGNVLMQARKMANHPLLHRIVYTDAQLKLMARKIMSEEQ